MNEQRVSDDRLACWLRHSENMQQREDEEFTIDANVPRYYGDVAALLRELQQYRSQRCETCYWVQHDYWRCPTRDAWEEWAEDQEEFNDRLRVHEPFSCDRWERQDKDE